MRRLIGYRNFGFGCALWFLSLRKLATQKGRRRQFEQKVTKVTKGFGIGLRVTPFGKSAFEVVLIEAQVNWLHRRGEERQFEQKVTKVTKGFGIGTSRGSPGILLTILQKVWP